MGRSMARDSHVFLGNFSSSFIVNCAFILTIVVHCSQVQTLQNGFMENRVCSDGNISDWFHCPKGWTLFKNRCFKITEAALTWSQAQTVCRSVGGNLVRITSQCEQNWVSQFLRDQLRNVPHEHVKSQTDSNTADLPSVEAWIGFIQLPEKTFQWSDGQAGFEQDGFWAVDGLKISDGTSSSRHCCSMKAQFPNSQDFFWQLTACDELLSSVCELNPCEKSAEFCADGSKCLNKEWLCDGHWDCQDGSDEKDCAKDAPHLVTTEIKHCVSVLKGQTGTFCSPNYPEEYPPFLNCLWKIETTPSKVIEIVVESLDTEDKYDILNIYEGMEAVESQLIVSLGGAVYNQTVKSLGSFVTLHFVSDHSVQAKGFNISWKTELERKPCGGQLIAGEHESVLRYFQLEFDSLPLNLLKVLNCDWLISSQKNTSLLSLQFKNITLVNGDSITVYDGMRLDAPVITHITSNIGAVIPSSKQDFSLAAYTHSLNIPPVITSSGQHVLLRVIIARGSLSSFVVTYKNGCDVVISPCSSLILSPGYPRSQYPNNLSCNWTVLRDKLLRHYTLIFLPDFLTEADKDYVQVYNSDSPQQVLNVTRFSGQMTGSQQGISSHQGFLIKFESDPTVNHGRWIAVISQDCVPLSVLPPLVLNSSNTQFGVAVGYSCLKSFTIVGPTHATCGWNGQWQPSNLPSCTKINCGSVPVPPGAYLTNVTGVTYGSSAEYRCLHGYNLVGDNKSVCGENGWEDVPTCKLIQCPKEYPPLGGNAEAEDIRVGYMREFFCKPNLQLVGSKFSHCNVSGQWTHSVPVCEAQKCPSLYGLLHGQLNETGPVAIGDSVSVVCDKGFKLVGQHKITCMDNLQFSHPLPSCTDIDECESSEICGIHLCQNFISNYSCLCQKGYKHLDNSTKICVDINECEVNNGGCSHICVNLPGKYRCVCPHNMTMYTGSWDHIGGLSLIPNKTCITFCKPLVTEVSITVVYSQKSFSSGELMHGTTAEIICPSGLYPNGASKTSCVAGSGWTSPVTKCIELFCDIPKNISNGAVTYSNVTVGSFVMYSCKQNYKLQGPRIRYCVPELHNDIQVLNWTGIEPTCVSFTCPDLQSPAHGKVYFTSTTYNSIAVFRCQCGFQLVGMSVVRCRGGGHWNYPNPTCEAQSCLHPGLPPKAAILESKPGFPVESVVRFQCIDKGYQLSDQNAIKCLPCKHTQVSVVKPSIDMTVNSYFLSVHPVAISGLCVLTYRVDEIAKKWSTTVIQLCEALNVAVYIQNDTSSRLISHYLHVTLHLLLSSDNTPSVCHCQQEILSHFKSTSNSLRLVSMDSSCPEVTLRQNDSAVNYHWLCISGLRLKDGAQSCGDETLPSCMEDCIDEGIETALCGAATETKADGSHMTPQTNTFTTPLTETMQSAMQETSVSPLPEIYTTSILPNMHTTSATLVKTSTEENSLMKTTHIPVATAESERSQQTDSTTEYPTSTETTLALPLTTVSNPTSLNPETFEQTTKYTQTETFSPKDFTRGASSPITQSTAWFSITSAPLYESSSHSTEASDITTRRVSSDTSFPELSSSKPDSSITNNLGGTTKGYSQTFVPVDETTTESNIDGGVFQRTTSSSLSNIVNCTTERNRLSSESHQFNTGQETTVSWSENGEDSNTSDCMTTHTLEKLDVTSGQGSPSPSLDLSTPLYSVEVSDYMWGSFANISCLDTVHDHINSKVNELVREFGNKMRTEVCRDAPDILLELTAGNVRFRGTRAKIFVKFSLTYSISSTANVQNCGLEFRNYTTVHLPQKFEKVESDMPLTKCKSVNYTGHDFNISYHGWSCHNGYSLDEIAFQCFRSSTKSVPTYIPAATSSPPVPVFTVPSSSTKFIGTFITSDPEDRISDSCIKEYKLALIQILVATEPSLQSQNFRDIYVTVDQNINVSLSDKKIIVEVTVNLVPLKESVDSSYMNKCASFISVQFREPSQQTSITVPKLPLTTCPVLNLSPDGFRTNMTKFEFFCAPGYHISKISFKCVNESLPLYSYSVEIVLKRTHEAATCDKIMKISAEQLVKDTLAEVHLRMTSRSICNTSEDVIIFQEQEDITIGKHVVNISMTITLVSMQDKTSGTLVCAEEVYNYLKSILLKQMSLMINNLPLICVTSLTVPQNYTVHKSWTCSRHRMYDQSTQQCRFITTQAPASQTTGMKLESRQKRSVETYNLRPQWNATLPSCIDIQPPTFNSCPVEPVNITLGYLGPVPVKIPLPSVTDNSGKIPQVTLTPDVSLSYGFDKNTTVVMEAKDDAGNIAVCIFNVTVIDLIPPRIKCPQHLVTIFTETVAELSEITYNNTGVVAADNSGSVSVLYDPPEGALVRVAEVMLVKASAVDGNFNEAYCSFFARLEVQGCPEAGLPHPEGGNKSCVSVGTEKKGLSCVVSCPSDKGFAVQPQEQYVCNGHWLPQSRMPQCVVGRFPKYELRLSFNLPYQGNETSDCLEEMLNAVIESVKPKLVSACGNARQNLNLTHIDSVGSILKSPLSMMTAKLKISIQLSPQSLAVTSVSQWCGDAVLKQLEFNGTLQGSCGQIKLNAPIASARKISCPEGFTNAKNMCYECPAGSYLSKPVCKKCPKESYQNTSETVSCMGLGFECPHGQYSTEPKCLDCPIGTFQNLSGSSECATCQSGYSTLEAGARSQEECIAKCKENYFSYSGLEPCIPCPTGQHQPNPGSKGCVVCDFNSDGLSQTSYCKKQCDPGEYSSDGTYPCIPCPQNYFSQNNGSTTCVECPGNKVTRSVGSVSIEFCEVGDPCTDNPCKHQSQCQPHDRDFVCKCLPGFTGRLCEDKLYSCDSHVCQNNGTCQQHDAREVACLCLQDFTGLNCEHDISMIDSCVSNPCVYGSCMNAMMGFKCTCYSGFQGDRCDMKTDNCDNITCYNGGTCMDLTVDFKCSCREGFTGNQCEAKLDSCQGDHCLNGRTCTDSTGSFACLCPPGFTGDSCEINIDECASSPCLNKGLCQDGIHSFRCFCLPPYTGNYCEFVVDPCEEEPCWNNATCLKSEDVQSDFYCKCKEGYTGEICEQDIDFCHPLPCSLQGSVSCDETVSGFRCNCLPGWQGQLCDEQMDLCDSHPCYTNATCESDGITFVCKCSAGFTGPTCSSPINSCLSSPCQNLGTCLEKHPSFSCNCPPGFTGSVCEVNINECQSAPCLNNAHCDDGINAYTCRCAKGFAGEHCEVNVNECLSHPCQHNSSCIQLDGDFLCNCVAGFTGKQCGTEINECSPNPCQNQGLCVDQVGGFYCICTQGFSGAVCEQIIDTCQDHIICLNNATCQIINGKSVCQCTSHFTGPDCGKEKTANFDLHFLGDNIVMPIKCGNLSEMSLCLWVKFDHPESQGTYLILTSDDGSTPYLSLSGMYATSPLFSPKEVTVHVNDGHWHQLCFVFSTTNWMVFKNGQSLQQGKVAKWIFGSSLKLKLGQADSDKVAREWFKGHLHGVNIYSFALEEADILNMSQNCQIEMHGNLLDWVTVEPELYTDIQVIMPSECGKPLCSTGDHTNLCPGLTELDKTPPEVEFCPSTVVVTSEKTLVPVSWAEPEFSDNVGIVSVKYNFRSGQIFPHGQFLVIYLAYDAENNTAECSFNVFVRENDCIDPPPPTNGARICGTWEQGRYCIPSCTQNFHFLTPVLPYYRCGYEGIWNLPGGDHVSFPVCTRTSPPVHNIYGSIGFKGPECTTDYKLKLHEKMMHILTDLDSAVHLCGADTSCSYIQSLNIKCGADNFRERRDAGSERSLYIVSMNITLSSYQPDQLPSPHSLPDEVVYFIKNDGTESEFTLASADLLLSSHCLTGQMLINVDRTLCLNCPAGYFMTKESVCSPCPKGWYNDKPLQTVCVQCIDGLTTSSEGSTSGSQCFDICTAGTYFNSRTSKCELCPVGEYQNIDGQRRCRPCPLGLTTHFPGAKQVEDCQDLCLAGQELGLNGTCVDCPLGTYSSGKEAHLFCITCPYGLTTEKEKAVDESECTLKKCDQGHYHRLEDKSCYPCPLGTFQESRGAMYCEPCGVRLTTFLEGADSRSLCRPGKVNECELKVDNCDPDTLCIDDDDGYTCECKNGRAVTGQCIDPCKDYCNSHKVCSNDGNTQERDCPCMEEMCKTNASRESTYNKLVTASIVVSVIGTVVVLIGILITLLRRNYKTNQDKHVRMYRDETELVSFTNDAFDSLSTSADISVELNRDEYSLQMPTKMATRWHNQSFMSVRPFARDEIESDDL